MRRPAVYCVPLLFTLVGCQGVQSIFAPQGPRAAEIATLGWLLIAGGALVLLIVCLALWLAIRGGPQARSRLASSSAVIVGGIVFPAITLSALLGYDLWLLRAGVRANAEPAIRIEVVGEQWWWRVAYLLPSGERVASANEIRIPLRQAVEFELKSNDVIHSFWVPNLAGKVDMIPGRTTRLRVIADRPGVFRGQCAEYCGGPHAWMATTVVAMDDAEHAAWLSNETGAAADPQTDMGRSGKALFLAAGCGSCHAVRGTPAAGVLGPDLTHIGSRRSIGADLLPMTQADLARFIADGQVLKPGNRMPPFRIFSSSELDAVAAYLFGLR
jgi:cytochrome c oxidase subunit 2